MNGLNIQSALYSARQFLFCLSNILYITNLPPPKNSPYRRVTDYNVKETLAKKKVLTLRYILCENFRQRTPDKQEPPTATDSMQHPSICSEQSTKQQQQ